MGNFPSELSYTKSHEWAKKAGAEIVVGITAHAQEELRDVVFVDLPKLGKEVKQGEASAVIESVKAAFDIYAPVSGKIVKVNDAVGKTPQLVNQDCYGNGWLFAIAPSNAKELSGLMSADAYTKQLQANAH